MKSFARLAGSTATLLVASLAHAGVLVVASDGSADFTDLPAAVDAANDGDTLLVRTGVYVGPTIVGKSLNVVADTNATVVVRGSLEVHGLVSGSHVLVADMRIEGAPSTSSSDRYALRVSDCLGSVRVQQCELVGAELFSQSQQIPHAVSLEHGDDVSLVRTVCRSQALGSGVDAISSSVAIHDSRIDGGNAVGVQTEFGFGRPGGDGFDGDHSFLFTSNSEFHGGNGSPSAPFGSCNCGGIGGAGVSLGDNDWLVTGPTITSTAVEIQTVAVGGLGGEDFGINCALCGACDHCDGPPGQPFFGDASVAHLGGVARVLSARSVVREQTVLALHFEGVPADDVALFVARSPGFEYVSQLRGVMLTKQVGPDRAKHIGKIGADGTLTYLLTMPTLRPSEAARTLFLQAEYAGVGGKRTLGSPLALVVLDGAF